MNVVNHCCKCTIEEKISEADDRCVQDIERLTEHYNQRIKDMINYHEDEIRGLRDIIKELQNELD